MRARPIRASSGDPHHMTSTVTLLPPLPGPAQPAPDRRRAPVRRPRQRRARLAGRSRATSASTAQAHPASRFARPRSASRHSYPASARFPHRATFAGSAPVRGTRAGAFAFLEAVSTSEVEGRESGMLVRVTTTLRAGGPPGQLEQPTRPTPAPKARGRARRRPLDLRYARPVGRSPPDRHRGGLRHPDTRPGPGHPPRPRTAATSSPPPRPAPARPRRSRCRSSTGSGTTPTPRSRRPATRSAS